MANRNSGTDQEYINPYITFSDLMVHLVLVMILFTVSLSLAVGVGSGEIYKREQESLLHSIREAMGPWAPELVTDRNDPGGAQRYVFLGADLFDPDSARLTERGQELLLRFSSVLKRPENLRLYRRIRIEGHARPVVGRTDDWSRWELSCQMALAVGNLFHREGQIPSHLLAISGRGGQAPADRYIPGTLTLNPRFDPTDPKHVRVEIIIEFAEHAATGERTR